MRVNSIPGKTLDTIIDDAFCACGIWEIRLDKWESPRLESRAGLYPIEASQGEGIIAISCDELRSHYRRFFGIEEAPPTRKESAKSDVPEGAIGLAMDDDDDGWGDEYLDDDEDEETAFRPQVSPTPEQYMAWKLALLSIIRVRYEKIEHTRSKGK